MTTCPDLQGQQCKNCDVKIHLLCVVKLARGRYVAGMWAWQTLNRVGVAGTWQMWVWQLIGRGGDVAALTYWASWSLHSSLFDKMSTPLEGSWLRLAPMDTVASHWLASQWVWCKSCTANHVLSIVFPSHQVTRGHYSLHFILEVITTYNTRFWL